MTFLDGVMKRGGTAIFMLGVAGVSLSMAMIIDNSKKPEFTEPEPSKSVISLERRKDPKTADGPDHEETAEYEEPTYTPVDYKEYYRQKKAEERRQREGVILHDRRYKGDGSDLSRKHYFRNLAYERARDANPIGTAHMLDTKIARIAGDDNIDDISDSDSDGEDSTIMSGASDLTISDLEDFLSEEEQEANE